MLPASPWPSVPAVWLRPVVADRNPWWLWIVLVVVVALAILVPACVGLTAECPDCPVPWR